MHTRAEQRGLSPVITRNITLRLLRNPLAIIIYLIAFLALGDSIIRSVLPTVLFIVIWEGMRRYLLRNTPDIKPTDTHRIVIFSDCVIAIAITLVAAQLDLPELKFGSGICCICNSPDKTISTAPQADRNQGKRGSFHQRTNSHKHKRP